jgi:hypothetical protein
LLFILFVDRCRALPDLVLFVPLFVFPVCIGAVQGSLVPDHLLLSRGRRQEGCPVYRGAFFFVFLCNLSCVFLCFSFVATAYPPLSSCQTSPVPVPCLTDYLSGQARTKEAFLAYLQENATHKFTVPTADGAAAAATGEGLQDEL